MNKAKIEKMARNARAKSAQGKPKQSAQAAQISSDAPKHAQECAATMAVNLTPETIAELTKSFSGVLRQVLQEVGPIVARVAAADTVHTVERPATVFARAIAEGRDVAALLTTSEGAST